ncbi:MAG: AmmeMemoRadiSam system radical SAM enzyme [Chloroflexi bacterium RBG_16_68_14]|nr:MAG: AmmeMemoRadiSam system radical SAM enzyme [Chloroflexi bacterium RBG_16_68_14]
MREGMLYERMAGGAVRCNVCAFRCIIRPGARGVCLVRRNVDGTLYTLVYGRTVTQEIDPIEKKPLFHFYPGSQAYSIATVGCNFRCRFCQNWEISQAVRDEHFIMGVEASPQEIVRAAQQWGCRSIAYTYTEPTIFFEYAYDTARLAHEAGLANIFVTNGYETPEALETIRPYLDAANVDLKSFSDDYYRRICTARLQPVLDTLLLMKRLGIWLEVTTLIIPTLNDSDEELRALTAFLAKELGPDTPWHVSRYFPAYRLVDKPVTPVDTLERAWQIGREAGLRYVYIGNVPAGDQENTRCPRCGDLLIQRFGLQLIQNRLQDGRCPRCEEAIAGVW